MRTRSTIILGVLLAGAAALAAPGQAAARFGGGAIAEVAAGLQPVHLAQQRRQRPRAQAPRASANPVTTIESTYRDPSSRGSLLNCSFC